jgi:hypothetical protein
MTSPAPSDKCPNTGVPVQFCTCYLHARVGEERLRELIGWLDHIPDPHPPGACSDCDRLYVLRELQDLRAIDRTRTKYKTLLDLAYHGHE